MGEGMKEKSEDLMALALRITASLVDQKKTSVILRQSLDLCMRILNSDRALLISESAGGPQEAIEWAGDADKECVYSKTALRLVKEKEEPLLISDTVGDEVLGVQDSISRGDIRSVLCSQLKVGNRLFGENRVYLYLDSKTNRNPFSQADLEKFQLLSELIAHLVQNSETMAEQEAAIEELRTRVREKQFEDLIYSSDSFKKCLSLIQQVAPTDAPVLLIGETGTGKEMLARTVHRLSRRSEKPFFALNCAAIPDNLIESQLFGHEKGAFTGAIAQKKGYFEEASGGTLFLDEMGELPQNAQSQFLRVLQEGEIVRVGSAKPVKVDVRVITATHVDLDKAVSEGTFRKDLYYRLAVLPVNIPPVREREGDALLLAKFFLKNYCQTFGMKDLGFSREAEKSILLCSWPGNVREIQNRIQRAVITATHGSIGAKDLDLASSVGTSSIDLRQARETLDRDMISQALKRAPGNLTNAAKLLGVDRKSLRILLDKYQMNSL